ncbi:F-box/LRR-repeat protein 3-like [Quillaja saponaria]|uniref:F-box/LRR-repeat protein 3-like n=1 Tax=Quillaja saponaria TaxID=32244 RepID=A0AAD7LR07_QUISA|nr:F-box/LRR-repeat protein 3-like [Quillaja saponaria]
MNHCLKVFKCSGWLNFCDEYLLALADSVPLLEELDISINMFASKVSWDAMEAIAGKLKKLRRLHISGQNMITCGSFRTYFTDLSLEKLSVDHPDFDMDFDFVLSNYQDLVSLKFVGLPMNFRHPDRNRNILVKSLALPSSLQELEFCRLNVSYGLCYSIAQACLPLRSVKNHDHLQFLNLCMNPSLDDEMLEKLTHICPNLEFLHVTRSQATYRRRN